jgi:hypothetical protein
MHIDLARRPATVSSSLLTGSVRRGTERTPFAAAAFSARSQAVGDADSRR